MIIIITIMTTRRGCANAKLNSNNLFIWKRRETRYDFFDDPTQWVIYYVKQLCFIFLKKAMKKTLNFEFGGRPIVRLKASCRASLILEIDMKKS